MSKLDTEPYKGVRDFYPGDMKVQNYIFDTWKKVALRFNYEEYGASILEPAELYKSKTSEEIVNEQTFSFMDRGGREVVLRPEMTPTLARMVAAKRKSLKFPLRWFSIPNVFRYEQPQRGRKREHWQFNADLLGIAEIDAEVEIISMAYEIMKEFGAEDKDFEIRINDRKIMEKNIPPLLKDSSLYKEALRLIDRKNKISQEEFEAEWHKLSDKEFIVSAGESLDEISGALNSKGIKNVKFDPMIIRGFDYYTGMVFEIFDSDPSNLRSLFGGGRYDNLLELFGVDPIPTVGFACGDITTRDFLETHKLGPYA